MKEFLKNDRFAAMAGVELLEVECGYAKARMLLTPDHMNAVGVCQGGALFTLADLAFAAVANNGVHRHFPCPQTWCLSAPSVAAMSMPRREKWSAITACPSLK